MHHPNNNETLLITSGEFMILIVPLDNLNLTRMTLQVLVHRKISTSLTFTSIEFKYLKQTLITSTSYEALFLVPSDNVQVSAVWHSDL
jgi:hypothetical protein